MSDEQIKAGRLADWGEGALLRPEVGGGGRQRGRRQSRRVARKAAKDFRPRLICRSRFRGTGLR